MALWDRLRGNRTGVAGIPGWLDTLAQDVRYTVRALRGNRTVAVLIVILLALGIGANTAIFTIAHALVLRALPVKDPGGLVNLRVGNFMYWGYIEGDETLTCGLWKQVLDHQDVLAEPFAYADANFDAVLNGEIRETQGAYASGEAFRTLGVQAIAGRTFGPEDERDAAGTPVAVISYSLWSRAFAADEAAIGRTLTLEGKPFTIIGVTPPRFFGLTVGRAADVYVPLAAEPYVRGKDSAFKNPIHYWLQGFGRLRPGVTMEQAQSRLAALSPIAMRATLPSELPANVHSQYLAQRFALEPAASGVSYVRSELKPPLTILSAVALLLLLLASFTVANLLLAQATARNKEMAVRIAMGASRGRIMRQLGLESVALAFAGACAGVLLSRSVAALLMRVASSELSPVALDLSLDWTVFGFACAAGTLSAVLCGFAPALRAARVAPADAFRGGTATMSGSVMRARRFLLSAQIAITVVLIAGAVLFGATLHNLLAVEMGFNRDSVALAAVDLRRAHVAEEARPAFYSQLLERMQALPIIDSAAMCYVTPISGSTWQFSVKAETAEGWKPVHIHYNAVTPDYFRTFGTRLLAGRTFREADSKSAPFVAVVNAKFAQTAFGSMDAIGRRISMADPAPRAAEIVGIVEDARYRDLRAAPPPTVYTPFVQNLEQPGSAAIGLHSRGGAEAAVQPVISLLNREYPNLSFRVTTLRAQVGNSVARERAFAMIFMALGGLALCLAAVGIYGVLAYFVEQRRVEFGIRAALGATPADIRRLVYRQSLSAFAIGCGAGCLFALWGARFTQAMLFGITPAAPAAYITVIGILALVAMVATVAPAARGAREECGRLLRSE
ncbi:MAG: ABC transporter permease [Bryobacteraceae bacterium]|nr:ABC transporter permease [Bryobacteraceae bacterium]